MLVSDLAKCKFKLLVYFINQADNTSRPIEMNGVHSTQLSEMGSSHPRVDS